MKCDRAREWLSDLVDGSIRPAQRVVLEAHLAVCAACAAESEQLHSLWSDLSGLPPVEAPTTLRATIWQRIQAAEEETHRAGTRPARLRSIPGWVRVVGVAAAVVAVIAMARVTVPGRYRAAGWLTWLSGGSRTAPTVGHAGPVVVSAAELLRAEPTQGGPGCVVAVTLRASRATAVPVRLRVMRGERELARLSVKLTARAERYRVPLMLSSGYPTELRIEWLGVDNVTQTHLLPLR